MMTGWTRTVRNFYLFAGDICQSSGAASGAGERLAVTTRRNNGARGIGRGGQSSSSRGQIRDFLGEGSGLSRGRPTFSARVERGMGTSRFISPALSNEVNIIQNRVFMFYCHSIGLDGDDNDVSEPEDENAGSAGNKKEVAFSSSLELYHKNVFDICDFLGSICPGSRRSYQEVSTEFVRDYMIAKQVPYEEVVASQVVIQIRVNIFIE